MGGHKINHFYKTKICPWYFKGKCERGTACRYAHNDHERRILPDLSRTSLCPVFVREGVCDDPNCRFAHDIEQLRATDNVYKTSLCFMFMKNKCQAGSHCRHAHGAEELRICLSSSVSHDSGSLSQLNNNFLLSSSNENGKAQHENNSYWKSRGLSKKKNGTNSADKGSKANLLKIEKNVKSTGSGSKLIKQPQTFDDNLFMQLDEKTVIKDYSAFSQQNDYKNIFHPLKMPLKQPGFDKFSFKSSHEQLLEKKQECFPLSSEVSHLDATHSFETDLLLGNSNQRHSKLRSNEVFSTQTNSKKHSIDFPSFNNIFKPLEIVASSNDPAKSLRVIKSPELNLEHKNLLISSSASPLPALMFSNNEDQLFLINKTAAECESTNNLFYGTRNSPKDSRSRDTAEFYESLNHNFIGLNTSLIKSENRMSAVLSQEEEKVEALQGCTENKFLTNKYNSKPQLAPRQIFETPEVPKWPSLYSFLFSDGGNQQSTTNCLFNDSDLAFTPPQDDPFCHKIIEEKFSQTDHNLSENSYNNIPSTATATPILNSCKFDMINHRETKKTPEILNLSLFENTQNTKKALEKYPYGNILPSDPFLSSVSRKNFLPKQTDKTQTSFIEPQPTLPLFWLIK